MSFCALCTLSPSKFECLFVRNGKSIITWMPHSMTHCMFPLVLSHCLPSTANGQIRMEAAERINSGISIECHLKAIECAVPWQHKYSFCYFICTITMSVCVCVCVCRWNEEKWPNLRMDAVCDRLLSTTKEAIKWPLWWSFFVSIIHLLANLYSIFSCFYS